MKEENYKYLNINNKKYATYLIEDEILYVNIEKWHGWHEDFVITIIQNLETKNEIVGVAFLNI